MLQGSEHPESILVRILLPKEVVSGLWSALTATSVSSCWHRGHAVQPVPSWGPQWVLKGNLIGFVLFLDSWVPNSFSDSPGESLNY